MRRIATLVVFLLTWALLLYQLTAAPPGFQHDQTFTVWDALDVRSGQFSFYFFRNFGREPVFMYSVAAATALLGDQLVWALRFTSIVWGMLAFVLTFKLAQRYLTPWIAVLVAALMAGSFWFLFMARLGLEPIAALTLGTAMVLCLDRGLVTGRRRAFVWAGLFGALAVYTYLAGRALYLLPPLLLAHQFVVWPVAGGQLPPRRRRVVGLLLTLLVMVVLTVPLFLYLQANAARADLRVGELGGPLAALRQGQFGPLLTNVGDALLGLVWRGSPALPFHYNLPGRPALQPIWAAFFLIGLLAAIWHWRTRRDFMLLCVVLLGLAPSLITSGDALYVRSIIALPAVWILVGRGLSVTGEGLSRLLPTIQQNRRLTTVLLGGAALALLTWHLVESGNAYFVRWAQAEPTQRVYNGDWRALAGYLRGRNIPQVIVGTDRLRELDSQTYRFYAPDQPDHDWFLLPDAPPMPVVPALVAWPASAQQFPNSWPLLAAAAEEPFTLRHPTQGYALIDGFTVTPAALQAQLDAANVKPLQPAVDYGGFLQLAAAGLRPDPSGLQLTTVWEAQGKWPRGQLAGPKISARLVDASGYTWSQVDVDTDLPFRTWQPGQRFLQVTGIPVPADAPPGEYAARLALYEDTQGPFPSVAGDVTLGDTPIVAATVLTAGVDIPPTPPQPVETTGDGALVALGQWDPPARLVVGLPAVLRVTWQAKQDVATADLRFTVRASGADGTRLWEAPADPISGLPAIWPAGQAYRLAFPVVPALDQTGTTDASLELCAHVGAQPVTCARLGTLPVTNQPPQMTLDQPPQTLAGVTWGDQIELVGYDVAPSLEGITLTLVWRNHHAPTVPLRRFVHVVDADGNIIAQDDAAPGDTPLPVTHWRPGEYVSDRVTLSIPAGQVPRAVYVGLYDPATGTRPVARQSNGNVLPEGRYVILWP